jgi:predicted DNA-binding protein
MKRIKVLVLLSLISCMLSQEIQASGSTSTSSSSRANEIRQKAAAVQKKVSAAKQAPKPVASPSSEAPKSSLSTSAATVQSLIEEFIKAMEEIPCSCGAIKKGDKVDPKSLCKHDSDHVHKVKKAYEAYEKLHGATHGSSQSISSEDEKKVKPHVEKLFSCKNIKNKAWNPKITR